MRRIGSIFGAAGAGLGRSERCRAAVLLTALSCMWSDAWPALAPTGCDRDELRPDDPRGLAARIGFAIRALEAEWAEQLAGASEGNGLERIPEPTLADALAVIARLVGDGEQTNGACDPIARALAWEAGAPAPAIVYTAAAMASEPVGLDGDVGPGEWILDRRAGSGLALARAGRSLRQRRGAKLARTATYVGITDDPESALAARLSLICEGLGDASHVFAGSPDAAVVAPDSRGDLRELRFDVNLGLGGGPVRGGARAELIVPARLVDRQVAIPRDERGEAIAGGCVLEEAA